MADISMCFGKNCAMRFNCYRFRAEVAKNGYQSYGKFDRVAHSSNDCDMFWHVEQAEGPLSDDNSG